MHNSQKFQVTTLMRSYQDGEVPSGLPSLWKSKDISQCQLHGIGSSKSSLSSETTSSVIPSLTQAT